MNLRRPVWIATIAPLIAALLSPPRALPAPAGADPSPCLRFRFGTWTPPLDWKRAGHASAPESVQVERAAGGQAWAVGIAPTPTVTPGDTLFVLYPAFWPAGVSISFDARALATSDTVTGRAVALVADGRQTNSTATAVIWRVPCRA